MQLCLCVTDTIIQHYVRCIESDGLHVEYLVFLQTVVKSEGQYLRKCQDIVMQEVGFLGCLILKFFRVILACLDSTPVIQPKL